MIYGISVIWRNRELIEEHVGSNVTVLVHKQVLTGVGGAMAIEQLIESVEVSAEERITELREKAYQQSVEIRREAEGKDEAIKKKHLDAVKKTVQVERNKLIAKIKDETRMQFTRPKTKYIRKPFLKPKKFSHQHDRVQIYENNFRKMLQEAVLELEGEDIQLHIDKRDENLCKKVLSELKLNCEVVTDITSAGGLNASTKDGRFILFNTIENRDLRRQRIF